MLNHVLAVDGGHVVGWVFLTYCSNFSSAAGVMPSILLAAPSCSEYTSGSKNFVPNKKWKSGVIG